MNDIMTVICVEFEVDNFDLQLLCNDTLIATVQITFKEHGDFDTNTVLQKGFNHAPLFGALHATSIVLSTLFNSWEEEHETVPDVFSNDEGYRSLVVDPALYQ